MYCKSLIDCLAFGSYRTKSERHCMIWIKWFAWNRVLDNCYSRWVNLDVIYGSLYACYEWCNAMRMIFCYVYDYIYWYMLNDDNVHTCWEMDNWNDNTVWLWPMKVQLLYMYMVNDKYVLWSEWIITCEAYDGIWRLMW